MIVDEVVANLAGKFSYPEHMCEKIPRKAANINTERAIRAAISETRKQTLLDMFVVAIVLIFAAWMVISTWNLH